ncbi:potassium transporter-domain-containing protein [Dipodascopsis tothii]|uniref:potassium transporter-domain-containing protein n=1 Tax=Dipodascopsis tothii TaxID=44089 RepID=UPI0034CD84DA
MLVSLASLFLRNAGSRSSEVADKLSNRHGAKRVGAATTIVLCLQSLGAIYGDIGTSPLYVYSSIFPSSHPSEDDVMGAMSCIFWCFTIVVIAKYCFFVLIFGPNNGEGGQVAIYAKLARTLKVGPRGVVLPGDEETDLLSLTRTETRDSYIKNHSRNSGFFFESVLPKLLLFLCFLGCGLVISDGLLTPTTSVLSAIGGIAVAAPSLTDAVMPISCGVLIVLFAFQRFGSGKISSIFAPIVLIWLLMLLVTGIINTVRHPSVYKAFSPKYAIDFLKDEGGIDVLGAVMLSLTGVEAMFADMGHFGRFPIQITLSTVVYPSLMFAYFGQAAYLIEHPDSIANVFYLSIPGGVNSPMYWIMFSLATLATIIASQALILGVFSILGQMIQIDCFPRFEVVHTSRKVFGQVYIPAVNYILMVGVVLMTVGFKNSNAVTAAYGLGISIDFLITSLLISLCFYYVYETTILVPIMFMAVFGSLDCVFIVAGMKKVPHGAWFPLMMCILVASFITFWRWARALKVDHEYNARIHLHEIFDGYGRKRGMDVVPLGVRKEKSQHSMQEGSETAVDTYTMEPLRRTNVSEVETTEPIVIPGRADMERGMILKDLNVKLMDGSLLHVARVPGSVAILHTDVMHTMNSPNTVPKLFSTLLQTFPAIPETFIFLGIRVTSLPFGSIEDRITVEPMKIKGFYKCVVKFGFMDIVNIDDDLVSDILARIPLSGPIATAASASTDSLPIKSKQLFEEADASSITSDIERGTLNGASNVKLVRHIISAEKIVADRKYPNKSVAGCLQFVRSFALEHIFSPLTNMLGGIEQYIEETKTPKYHVDGRSFGKTLSKPETGILYIGETTRL